MEISQEPEESHAQRRSFAYRGTGRESRSRLPPPRVCFRLTIHSRDEIACRRPAPPIRCVNYVFCGRGNGVGGTAKLVEDPNRAIRRAPSWQPVEICFEPQQDKWTPPGFRPRPQSTQTRHREC